MEVTSYLLGKKAGGGSTPILQQKSVTITENGTESITADTGYDGLSVVNINTDVPTSSASTSKDVVFYDYDGTELYTYSAEDFLALTNMPENPTHEGLISKGWNWDFETAQDYVESYGKLNIGQMYDTPNDVTRIYLTITETSLDPYLTVSLDSDVDATIDWGDNSSDTITGLGTNNKIATQHIYNQPGGYVITISCDDYVHFPVNNRLISNNVVNKTTYPYLNSVTRVEFGKFIFNNAILQDCASLESVILSTKAKLAANDAESVSSPSDMFRYCCSLKSLTIPNTIVKFGNTSLYECFNLETVIFPDTFQTNNNNSLANCFYNCYSLKSVTLPVGVVMLGDGVFRNCHSIEYIIVPAINTISQYTFNSLYSLKEIVLSDSVSSIGGYAFSNAKSLKKIRIPNAPELYRAFSFCSSLNEVTFTGGITNLNQAAFDSCTSLKNIVLPDNTTTLSSAFTNCDKLETIVFPKNLTTINSTVVSSNTFCLRLFDFSNCVSIPTITSQALGSPQYPNYKIVVPDALYEDWIVATNWSNYASNIIKKSDYDNL
jgi:hypothetical protein